MTDETKQVAGRLREIREVCGCSAQETAARLGIPAAQYLAYEQSGENIPISVLYELANAYGVDITEILTGKSPRLSNYFVTRHGQGKGVDRYPGYRFHNLAHNFKRRIMEPLLVAVEPGEADMTPIAHPGQEFNYVIEGTVLVILGDEEILLEAGDCVYFDPTIPHGQRAVGGAAKFLTVIAE